MFGIYNIVITSNSSIFFFIRLANIPEKGRTTSDVMEKHPTITPDRDREAPRDMAYLDSDVLIR